MATPQNKVEGYWKSSPVHFAKDLHGKLLLIHGAIDDNVHMANTIRACPQGYQAGRSTAGCDGDDQGVVRFSVLPGSGALAAGSRPAKSRRREGG